MNRLQYRIVFNKQRGQLMAVAETALSHSKGGTSGESDAPARRALGTAETAPAASRGPPSLLALAAAFAMGAAITLTPDALAQVKADPNAPKGQQPTVVNSANGTVQVNIQTPSAAGVSRNSYSQFDVDKRGVILNNSRTDVSTQLGGYVQANPWLAKGGARVILNEVNSSAPSQLKGYVEVAGQRAEVVIANPSGIQVDGAGFINASAAVLTTGTPRFNVDGSIAGYGVQGGLIRVDGAGLDGSSTDYTALLARAVEINAGIWAKDARIQTGTQVMTVDETGVAGGESLAPTGERPRYALDSTALGGIYAQRITLVGTEAGLGVRQAGQVVGGQLTLRADGWLDNTGTVYAQEADANGTPALTVQSNAGVRNAGWLASRGSADIRAPQLNGETGSVTAAGMTADGAIVAGGGQLSLTASQSAKQAGQLLAADRLAVQAPALDLGGAQAQAGSIALGGDTVAARESLLIAGSGIDVAGSASVDLTRAQVQAATVAATAPTLIADGAQLSATGTLSLKADGTLSTQAASLAGGKLAIAAHDADLRQAEWLQIGTDALSVRVDGTMTADAARIASNGASLSIAANAFSAIGASLEQYGSGALSIDGQSVHLNGATLWSNGALSATAAQLTLDGADAQARAIALKADGTLSQQRATLRTTGTATLSADRVDNRDGRVAADGGLTVQAGTELRNDRGELQAASGGIAIVGQADIANAAGLIAARDGVSVQGRSLVQEQGAAIGGQDVTLTLQGELRQDASSSVSANRRLDIDAQAILSDGQLRAGGALGLTARDSATLGGSVYGAQVTASASGTLSVAGLLAAQGQLSATAAQRLQTSAGSTVAAGLGTDGHIGAQGALAMTAGSEMTLRGQVLAVDASLDAMGLDLNGAQVQAVNTLNVKSVGELNTEGARLSATSLSLQAQDWRHAGGQLALSGSGDLSVALTGRLDNRQGVIQANAKTVSLTAQTIDNTAGKIVAGGNALNLRAESLANQGGTVTTAGDLSVDARLLDNRDGELSGGQVGVTSRQLDNTGNGLIAATGNLTIRADALTNAGTLQAQVDATIAGAGTLANSGLIRAGGAATVEADTLTHAGTLAAGNALTVRAGAIDSTGTFAAGLRTDNTIAATGDLALNAARTLKQSGTTLAGGFARIDGGDLQLQGSQTQAADLIVRSHGGDLRLDRAAMVATGGLELNAGGALVTDNAQLSGGAVKLSAADWRNAGGEIGQTDAAGRLTATIGGTLDNSGGRIAGNGSALSLSAQRIDNVAGQVIHAGGTGGELRLDAATLDGAGGTIAGAGRLTLNVGGHADLGGASAVTQADRVSVTAGSLSTRDAKLVAQNGAQLAVMGEFDNTGGLVQSGGAVAASAGSLVNRNGQIGGVDVTLTGASVDNAGLGLIAAQQRLSVDVGSLGNAGTLQAGGDVDLRASARLDNAGMIRAGGDAQLRADALTNTGTIAARGSLGLDAATIDSSGALAAGLRDDNTVAATGDLTVAATGQLRQGGTALAGGAMTLTGGELALQGGKFQAQRVTLNALAGDLRLDGAALSGGERLMLATAGVLDTSSAVLSAGSVAVTAGDWRNVAGDIAQTASAGTLTVSVAGTLDNQRGSIAGNAADLTIVAGVLDNRAGSIVHAGAASGTLALTVSRLDGTGGEILGKGALVLRADGAVTLDDALTQARRVDMTAVSLSLRDGQLVSESGATLTAAGAVDNTRGVIQTAEDLRIDAASLANTAGQIGGRAVDLSTSGALINGAQGLIASTQAMTIAAGRLDNAGSLQSQAAMDLTVHGAFSNTGTAYARGPLTITTGDVLGNTGMLASQGALAVQADSIASSGGFIAGLNPDNTLGAQGDLTLRATGVLQQSGQTLAAGAMSLRGATLQLQDAKLQARTVGLTATAGALQLNRATVASAGALTLGSTGALDTGAAAVSGNSIAIAAQRWSNVDGTVTQTGQGGQGAALSATLQGALDNTRGEIASAGRTLAISAGAVNNTQGRVVHAGGEGLRIDASSLGGVGGEILGAQAVTLAVTGAVDLSQAKTQGAQVTIEAGSLRHQGGQLLSAGDAQLRVTGALDNAGGAIVATRDLLAQAGSLDNTGGQIGARNVDLTTGTLTNGAQGLINAQGALTVGASQLTNAGALQSGTDTRLTVTGDMSNSGSVYAQGNAVLNVGNALANTGAIGAQGGLTIDAASLSGTGSLAAGLRPDNSLATQGDLTVRTSGTLQSGGAMLSAGALVLNGRDLQLQDSRLQAASASLTSTGGPLRLDRAALASAGNLMLASAGLLSTDGATLSGASVGLTASDWRNVGGSLTQLGSSGQLTATVGGQILNTDGRIQAGGSLLRLQAQAIDNVRGSLVQAGSGPLTLSTGTLSGAGGQILSNGALTVGATGAVTLTNAQTQGAGVTVTGSSLDHRGGNLVSTGAAQLNIVGAIDNTGGTLASAGALDVRGASLSNGGNGLLQSDSTLQATFGGTLDNQGGRLRSGSAMTLNAGTVDNRGGWAGSDGALTVTTGGNLLNGGGSLLAQQGLTLGAASVGNQTGRIASLQGNVTVRAQGALDNTQGAIQAAQTVDLLSTSLVNRQGEVSGASIVVDTRGQTLDNTGGRLLASQSLMTDSGTLENRGGLLQSGGGLSVQTHGAALVNTRDGAVSTPTGIRATGAMTIAAGTLTNENGISAGTSAQLTVSQLTNRAELSASALGLTVGGTLDNQGGRLIGGQSLSASAQQVLNQGGLIYGGGTLTLNAAGRIDNTGNAGSGVGIQGGNVTLQAQQLDNVGGQVLASGNLGLTITQVLNNASGALGASGQQTIGDGAQASALSLDNAGGRIWSGDAMGLNLRELAGGVGGQISSGAGMTVKLAGDFSYGAGSQFQATGDMTLNVSGNFSNQGTLRSGGGLSIQATNIDNAASGELSGALTLLTAAGQLNNRGLIDGDGVMLTADRVLNMGTGRIYGGDIVIDGGQLINGAEGGVSAVIAGRRSIDAAMTRDVSNTGGALIFADGVLTMSGASLLNENSIIEASHALGIQMTGGIVNRTVLAGVSTGQVAGAASGGTGGSSGGGSGGKPGNGELTETAPEETAGGGDVSAGTGSGGVSFLDTKAFIRSGGNMSLTGASLLNSGANIEARGDLLLQAGTIDNLNPYLAWTTNPGATGAYARVTYKSTQTMTQQFFINVPLNGKSANDAVAEWSRSHPNDTIVGYTVEGTGALATVTQSLAANIIVGGQLTVIGANTITNDMSRVIGYDGVAISGGKVNNVAHSVQVVNAQGVSQTAVLDLPSQAQSFIPASQGADGRQQAGGVSLGGGASQQGTQGDTRATAGGGSGLSGLIGRVMRQVNAGNAVVTGAQGGAQVRSGGQMLAQAVDAGNGAGNAGTAEVELRNATVKTAQQVGQIQDANVSATIQGGAQTGRSAVAQALRAAAAAQADGSAQADGKAMTQATKVLASSASTSQRPGAAQGVTLSGSGATFNGKPLALSVRVNLTPPSNSLFKTHKEPTSKYLIETDPRFANYKEWLSSDFLLQAMALDPTVTQKRLGDGFYEQRLVREQIGQLTGTGYLSGYADDESQYRALLTNGATFAKEHQLVPGVALTAEQMSQLTSDLVWLVEQTVTLADGTTQRVLVPQVYLVPREGDLLPSGSLIAGGRVEMALSGDFTNGGDVRGGAVNITAQNIANTGDMRGTTLALSARDDLRNIGGSLNATGDMSLVAGRDITMETTIASGGTQRGNVTTKATVLDQVASLSAGGVMVVQAGRDVSMQAVQITQGGADGAGADGGVLIQAGRDLSLTTVTTASARDEIKNATNFKKESQSQDVGTAVQAEGLVVLKAGQDLTAAAAQIASAQGEVNLSAGRDVQLLTGQATSSVEEMTQKTKKSLFKKKTTTTYNKDEQTLAIGTSLTGTEVTVTAGQDIRTEGATIKADGLALLDAKRDLLLGNVTESRSTTDFSQTIKKTTGLGAVLSLGSLLPIANLNALQDATKTVNEAVGTTVSAGSVIARAGRDAALQGATVVADSDVFISAGRNLTLTTAESTESGSSSSSSKKSGFIGSWWQPAVGTVKTSTTGAQQSSSQTGSQVASLGGDVMLKAGEVYTQTGSSVIAKADASGLGGNVDIEGRKVVIEAAENSASSNQTSKFSKTALGGSVSVPIVSAAQGVLNAVKAGEKTEDSRMQALAGLNAALAGMDAVKAGQDLMGKSPTDGIKISVSLGTSKSQSSSTEQSTTVVGSQVKGQGDVSIRATGGGQDSTLNVAGSDIVADGKASLKADGAITLAAAQSSQSLNSSNSSSGGSIGIGYAFGGTQNGFTLDASVNKGKGRANGNGSEQTQTHVNGTQVAIESGGDTTLKGAVITGGKVTGDIGGNLNIESLQDSATYSAKQQSAGVGVSICIPPFCYGASSVSGSFSSAQAKGNFASVMEQSGIAAGEGGFQISVKGNTDLKAGAITSNQAAIDAGKNVFSTGTLTTSDIENRSTHSASAVTVSGGTGGGMAGAYQDKGDERGTARSTISTAATTITSGDPASQTALDKIDRGATSADTVGKVSQGWDGQKLMDQGQVNAQILAEFGAAATKQAGKFADEQSGDIRESAQKALAEGKRDEAEKLWAEAEKWDEGGAYRVALHTAIGGLTGGLDGALGGLSSQYAVPKLGDLIKETDLPLELKQGLVLAAGTAIGAVTGNAEGAAIGFDATANNFLSAPSRLAKNQALAVLRADEQKNWFEKLMNPTSGVMDAAQTQEAMRYMDFRSDTLLNAYRQRPGSLSAQEINELSVYLGAYAASYGKQMAADLVKFGPGASADASDIPALSLKAQSLLLVNAVHEGQAEVGTPALEVLTGPVGTVARAVQAAKSSTQIGMGIAQIREGDTAAGLADVGLGLLGYGAAIAGQYVAQGKGSSSLAGPQNGKGVETGGGGVVNPLQADPGKIDRLTSRGILDQGPGTVSCGHNSCGMVLDSFGNKVDPADLIQRFPPAENGINGQRIVDIFKSNGVSAVNVESRNIADLVRYTETGTPVIARIAGPDGYSHFVVVDGVTVRNGVNVVAVRDPDGGAAYFSPVTTFKKYFTGNVVLPKKGK
ncbi:hemagglutinin repeat-containing protein [Roseateles noduli]|uniref:hemagglutinin repeat-containing protein n=1 Tax=Roseateles noduli TaxID=2052484 RepID=UPI003D6620DC